jgi:hypothetical protein
MLTAMPEASEPKPKRRRTLLRRLWLLALVGSLLLLAAAALGVWWAYEHRVVVANHLLGNLQPAVATAGGLEFDKDGNIEIKDFAMGSADNPRIVELPLIKAKVNWKDLPSGEIESISLDQPDLDFTEDMLRELLTARPAALGQPDRSGQPLKLRKLDIERASVSYQEKDGSIMDLIVTCHARDVAISAEGEITTGDQEFLIEEGALSHKQIDDSPFAVQRLHVKGRVRDGFVELDDFTCDAPALHVRPELIALFLPKIRPTAQEPSSPSPTSTEEPTLKGVRVQHAVIRNFEMNSRGFTPDNASSLTMPDTSAVLNYEADQLEWAFGGEPTAQRQTFRLGSIDLHPPTGDSHLRCRDAVLALIRPAPQSPWEIEKCDVDGLDVRWTKELRTWLMPAQESPAAASASSQPATPWSIAIKHGRLTNAVVRVADDELVPFELNTKGSASLADLSIGSAGIRSAALQSLTLEGGTCRFPKAAEGPENAPFFEFPKAELQISPDAWSAKSMVQKFALATPVVRLRKNTPWLGPALVGPPSPVPVAAAPVAQEEAPWWQKLQFEDLSISGAQLDFLSEDSKALDVHATLDVSTLQIPGGNLHNIIVDNIETRLPTLSKFPSPILQAERFEATVELPEMWRTRHIEELHLNGLRLTAGSALMKFFEQPKPSDSPPEEAAAKPDTAASEQAEWTCGHLSVSEGIVKLEHIVPGIPSVSFGVNFDVEDAPLSPDGLARNVDQQQVEITAKIPSPYEPLRNVADLDSVFIDFSLEGLMRKEIDKVQMVSPTLFVGEDLFWYVEYYRQFAATGVAPAMTAPAFADAVTGDAELQAAEAVVTHEPASSEAPWSVKTLEVHSGKLVLAPKGTPLPGFRTPFPFSFVSEVKQGTLEADFEIPPDTYIYEDLKLEFQGMKGRVQFNLPVKGKDNNLTEVFEVDRIRWKQMHVEKAFLSVTYDANGIYGKLGGSAYDGYVNGQFNIYMDDSFTWDGWISGTKVQLHEITQKLMPGYFLMDGQVEGKIVAAGDKNEIYQADGTFSNHTPGRFSVAAMNDLLNALPKEWAELQKQMTQIGLETLRDFQYEKTIGDFRLYGREGKGKLSFSGPAGSRNFEVNVFDHRWKSDEEKPKPTIAADAKP